MMPASDGKTLHFTEPPAHDLACFSFFSARAWLPLPCRCCARITSLEQGRRSSVIMIHIARAHEKLDEVKV